MIRAPYDADLCVQDPWDQDPAEFKRGFDLAARIETIYQAMRDSTGVPLPEIAAKADLPPTPWAAGFMLGVYGCLALRKAGL